MSDHEFRDDAFDEWLRTASRDYNDPPEPDREAVWRSIDKVRRQRAASRNGSRRWKRWGLGIAAALAIGVGIGRWAVPIDRSPANVIGVAEFGADGASAAHGRDYAFVTAEHLSRTEALLVIFRTAPRGEGVDPEVARWARDLLSTTRMIMDWSESDDPGLARLLTDLELVLVQIVQLPVSSDAGERELVERSIEYADVLPRLRAMLPPPPRRVGA